MTRHMALLSFTEQGIKNVQDSGKRAASFQAAVEAAGGKVVSQYWASGRYDGCVIFDAPNEETAATLLLGLGQKGNVRTQTLRLFGEQEFASLVGNL